MDIFEVLKIGVKLLVSLAVNPEAFYTSRLEDIRDGQLAIAVPLRRGQPLLLHYGDHLVVRVPFGDAAIEFRSQMVGDDLAPIQLYLIGIPDAWERVQQRGYVRLPLMMNVECRIGDRDAEPMVLGIADISGGGVCLRSKEKIRMAEQIWMRLSLTARKKTREIPALGKVVRSHVINTPKGDEYRLGVSFVRISIADQDFIMAFIFERMTEIRQRL